MIDNLRIKLASGPEVKIAIDLESSVQDLITQIRTSVEECRDHTKNIRLIFMGRLLTPVTNSLSSFKVNTNGVIHCFS